MFSSEEDLVPSVYMCDVFGCDVYRDTVVVLFDTQLDFAVQVDVTRVSRELEHVEREVVGCSQSISLHSHSLVSGIWTTAHKQRNKHHIRTDVVFRSQTSN